MERGSRTWRRKVMKLQLVTFTAILLSCANPAPAPTATPKPCDGPMMVLVRNTTGGMIELRASRSGRRDTSIAFVGGVRDSVPLPAGFDLGLRAIRMDITEYPDALTAGPLPPVQMTVECR